MIEHDAHGIVGEMGAGKTLSAVYFALRAYWKQRQIYSNIKLLKIPFTPVTSTEQVEAMREGFFLGDESQNVIILAIYSGCGRTHACQRPIEINLPQ